MKNNQTYKNDFLNEENNYSMSQIFLNTLSIFVTLMTYVQDSISVTFQDIIFLSSYRGQRGLTFFHFHIFHFLKCLSMIPFSSFCQNFFQYLLQKISNFMFLTHLTIFSFKLWERNLYMKPCYCQSQTALWFYPQKLKISVDKRN